MDFMMRAPLDSLGGSVLPHLLLPFTQILAFALPPFKGRAAVFVPIICTLVYATWTNLFTTNSFVRAFLVAQWPWYLGTIAKLLFANPEYDYWRTDRKPHEAMNMSFFQKLAWSASLYCSPRGIGWNYQVKGVPEYHIKSKKEFFVGNLLWLAVIFLLIDITNVYIIETVYDSKPDPSTMAYIEFPGSFFGRRFYNMFWGTLAMVYLPVQNLYTQIALVSVLCGGGQPKNWNPIYGNKLLEVTTLRKLWNTFWHQTIRKTYTDWSHGLMNILGIRRGTWLSTYFQLYLGFLMSGLGHGIVTYSMSYNTRDTNTFANRFLLFFNFMIIQAVAIHFEDFAIWCYKAWNGVPKGQTVQVKTWHRVIGLSWVLIVWCYSAKLAMLACVRNGISAEDSLPFSIVRPVLTKLGYF